MNASYEWLKAIVPFDYTPEQLSKQYYLMHSTNATYMEAYRADIILAVTIDGQTTETNIGTFGTLNPTVGANFKVMHPVNTMEIDLQPLIDLPSL